MPIVAAARSRRWRSSRPLWLVAPAISCEDRRRASGAGSGGGQAQNLPAGNDPRVKLIW
jgi:hypothetical protein